MDTKYRILRTYVWSILLYGCESWTITNSITKKLEATEMWFFRRILKISWTEKKSNQEVLEMANKERSLMKTIRKDKWNLWAMYTEKAEWNNSVWQGRSRVKEAEDDSAKHMWTVLTTGQHKNKWAITNSWMPRAIGTDGKPWPSMPVPDKTPLDDDDPCNQDFPSQILFHL